ncbi:hypothetical protein IFT59_18685 [Rhizobium sp. CFBP 8752]|uniref:hypothetical protein n=1 Tax=Rhizobium sp. CFBP 8752 TaxID=2775301 RepID=UPI0017849365|nr:hypothetical protein [Rhizobium sp. CFBP 8752]MBD8665271.1 hypothetical protein [Rhizobium sp. CFBP 8752]
MAKPMEAVGSGMRSFYNSMAEADTSKAAEMFTGQEREAFLKMEDLRQKMLPLMKAYADQSEDTLYLLRKCAR